MLKLTSEFFKAYYGEYPSDYNITYLHYNLELITTDEKEYKNIESPIQKKTFEEQIQKEFRAKEERIYNLKTQKEKTIRDNILAACKSVAAAKKLDVILDYGVVYAGGVDVTNDIIQYLNTQKK